MKLYGEALRLADIESIGPPPILNYTDMVVGANIPTEIGDGAVKYGYGDKAQITRVCVSTGSRGKCNGILGIQTQSYAGASNGVSDQGLLVSGIIGTTAGFQRQTQRSVISLGTSSAMAVELTESFEKGSAASNSTSDIFNAYMSINVASITEKGIISTNDHSVNTGTLSNPALCTVATDMGLANMAVIIGGISSSGWNLKHIRHVVPETGIENTSLQSSTATYLARSCAISNKEFDVMITVGGYTNQETIPTTNIERGIMSTKTDTTIIGDLTDPAWNVVGTSNGRKDISIICGYGNVGNNEVKKMVLSTGIYFTLTSDLPEVQYNGALVANA
ncbi:MAG: hypothetical protein GY804_08620 [Alphaproteobacteria bacterium]|nr:hypothetical protein [Alphaproteobacteria bacterium]